MAAPANQWAVTAKIAKTSLAVLRNKCVFAGSIPTEYKDEFARGGANQIGFTVNVRKPPRALVGEGPVIDPQAVIQTTVPVTINHQLHVAFAMTSADATLAAPDIAQIMDPYMAELGNKIDQTATTEMWSQVSNFVVPDGGLGSLDGRTSTAAQAIGTLATARQYLTEYAAPREGRLGVVAPKVETGLAVAYSTLFNPQKEVGDAFKTGYFARVQDFELASDVNIPVLTNGTLNATGATAATAQGSSNTVQPDGTTPYSLSIAALGATAKVGQVFTIAGVYAVNPRARQSLGRLQTFTVVGNGTIGTDVSATDTIMQIMPYPVFSGPFQNVYSATGGIAGSSTLTSVSGLNSSAYTQNLFYHPNAFAMATVKLWTPAGGGGSNGTYAFAQDPESGLSIRVIRDWHDVRTDQVINRIDTLMGVKHVYPELACRVSG